MGVREYRDGSTKSSLAVMLRSPDVSPRRLSDISPHLRQLNCLVVDECIEEKSSRSFEDLNSACAGGLTSIEERILRITGYYGYQPWSLRLPIHGWVVLGHPRVSEDQGYVERFDDVEANVLNMTLYAYPQDPCLLPDLPGTKQTAVQDSCRRELSQLLQQYVEPMGCPKI